MTFLYICAWVTSDVVRCKQPQSDLLYTEQLCWSGRVKGLAQRRLSGAGESGASAAFHFSPPIRFIPLLRGFETVTLWSQARSSNLHRCPRDRFSSAAMVVYLLGLDLQPVPGDQTPRTSWLVHDPLCKCSILVCAEQCAKKNPLVWGNYWAFSKNKTMCSWPAFKD